MGLKAISCGKIQENYHQKNQKKSGTQMSVWHNRNDERICLVREMMRNLNDFLSGDFVIHCGGL